jgi:RNA-dependent RNA polymerase
MLDSPISEQLESKLSATKDHESIYPLPFEVRYQLEVCISQGIMDVHNLSSDFVSRLADMTVKDQVAARHILEYAAEQGKRIYDPMTIFYDKGALAYSPKSKIPHYCAYSRKATVTPTTLYFSSPTVETTNRVIRQFAEKYGDRFLRVQFTDEIFEVCMVTLPIHRLY